MAICNLFRKISNPNGTFFTFSQYMEDITKYQSNPDYKVIPSKFICCDIDYSNFDNKTFPTILQNNFENSCSFLRENYNSWTPEVSKHIFWNELSSILSHNNILDIVYIGDINIQSYTTRDNMGFNEIYCYIPNDAKSVNVKYTDSNIESQYIEYPYDCISGYSLDDKDFEGLLDIDKIYSNNSFNNILSYQYKYNKTVDFELQEATAESSFKFNTIIVLYEIQDHGVTLYTDIPLGLYITGVINNGVMSNEVTKYISNGDIYGAGTSYGLRICSRFIATQNGTSIKSEVDSHTDEDAIYTSMSKVMSAMVDSQLKMNQVVSSIQNYHQDIKDHLAQFKNYRTNIPYIRYINDEPFWFVNGKNTGVRIWEGFSLNIEGDDDLLITEFGKDKEYNLKLNHKEYLSDSIENEAIDKVINIKEGDFYKVNIPSISVSKSGHITNYNNTELIFDYPYSGYSYNKDTNTFTFGDVYNEEEPVTYNVRKRNARKSNTVEVSLQDLDNLINIDNKINDALVNYNPDIDVEFPDYTEDFANLSSAAQENAKKLDELKSNIFDPDNNLTQNFVSTMMAQVGADSMNFHMLTTKSILTANGLVEFNNIELLDQHFKILDNDILSHFTYINGPQKGIWNIKGSVDFSLERNKTYYICLECSKDNNEGSWICSTTQHKVDEGTEYWYFNWGIITVDKDGICNLTETRGCSYMYGDNLMCGKISTITGSSYFDLNNGDFVLSDGTNAALSYIDGVLQIGSVNDDRVDEVLERLNIIDQDIEELDNKIKDTDVGELQEQITGVTSSIDNLTNDLGDLSTGLTDLSGDFESISSDLNGLNSNLSNLSGSVDEVNSKLEGLESNLDALEQELTESITMANSLIDNIQTQVDGEVNAWFLKGEPTLENAPANEWSDENILKRHLGDTFTNIAEYRLFDSNDWETGEIIDGTLYENQIYLSTSDFIRIESSYIISVPLDYKIKISYYDLEYNYIKEVSHDVDFVIHDDLSEYLPDLDSFYCKLSITLLEENGDPLNKDIIDQLKISINPSSGQSWRFCDCEYIDSNGDLQNGYHWHKIADSDSVKALQTAMNAKDIADGKRRVFTDNPDTPYDVGDLWVDNSNDLVDTKVCKVARSKDETYNSEDWMSSTEALNAIDKAQDAVNKAQEAVDKTKELETNISSIEKDAQEAAEILKGTLSKGETEIAGGLILSNILALKDINGKVTAGMSGLAKNDTSGESDDVLLWGGGSYTEAYVAAKNDYIKNESGEKINTLLKKNGEGKIGVFEIDEKSATVNDKNGYKKVTIRNDKIGNESVISDCYKQFSEVEKDITEESFEIKQIIGNDNNTYYQIYKDNFSTWGSSVDADDNFSNDNYNNISYVILNLNISDIKIFGITDVDKDFYYGIMMNDVYYILGKFDNKWTRGEGEFIKYDSLINTIQLELNNIDKSVCDNSSFIIYSGEELMSGAISYRNSSKIKFVCSTNQILMGSDGIIINNDGNSQFKMISKFGETETILKGLPTTPSNSSQLYRSNSDYGIISQYKKSHSAIKDVSEQFDKLLLQFTHLLTFNFDMLDKLSNYLQDEQNTSRRDELLNSIDNLKQCINVGSTYIVGENTYNSLLSKRDSDDGDYPLYDLIDHESSSRYNKEYLSKLAKAANDVNNSTNTEVICISKNI